VNSLAGEEVSRSGALRPTTRIPVVWTHRDHAHRYGADLLPNFTGDRPLTVVAHDHADLGGVTLVDAPDLDSIEIANRDLAEELLAAADLCVFVTSAQRYADAIPWEVLDGVRDRALPLVVVINRLPAEGADTIVADLRRRLEAGGIVAPELVTIAEQSLQPPAGLLPAAVAAPLRQRLARLADPRERRAMVSAAIASGLQRTTALVTGVVGAVAQERAEVQALHAAAAATYNQQVAELHRSLRDGDLIRGEVLARWQEFVGTGELLRVLTAGAGRVRGWFRSVLGGQQRAAEVQGEASGALAATIAGRADRAAATTAATWELAPAGRQLVTTELFRADVATAGRAKRAVEDWLAGLAALVEEHGEGRRFVARIASAGVNVAAASLMLAVFAQTGGLTGAEVGITAGAAAVQQRLLEHLFGSAAARQLVREGRERLEQTVADVLAADQQRFLDLLAPLAPADGVEDRLRSELTIATEAGHRLLREVASDA
jgi:hypothetical protein